MKDNRCFICKFNQEETLKESDDVIFDNRGNARSVPLCYAHSVELFKSGQNCFVTKYHEIFDGKYGSENDADLIYYFSEVRHRAIW